MMDWLRRHKFALLLAVVVAAYYPRFARQAFTLYPLGGQALLQGQPLEAVAPGFTYPPFFAFCMIPFTWLPVGLRTPLWYAVMVGSIIACFRVCERLCVTGEWTPRELGWLRGLTLLLSLKVTLAVFENQAYDSVVFLLILVGLRELLKAHPLNSAMGLGASTALKATPLLFFPYLLLRGRLKMLVLGLVFFAGFSFLPDLLFTPRDGASGYFVTWMRTIAGSAMQTGATSGEPTTLRQWQQLNPLNQSLRSVVYQWTIGGSYEPHTKTVLYTVYLAYLLVVGTLLVWPRGAARSVALDGSLVLISMLMLSPMSSKSHFVVLMLPYMLTGSYVIREPRFRWVGGTFLGLSFALITLTSRDLIGKTLSDLCLSAGCVVYGTLALLAALGYIILKQKP